MPNDLPDWRAATLFREQRYDWTGLSDPGGGLRATVTVVRASTVKPVLGMILATLWISIAGSSAARLNVWDGGETGAILATTIMSVPAQNNVDRLFLTGLSIIVTGTIGFAGVIAVSFDAAPAAGINQLVAIAGWDG